VKKAIGAGGVGRFISFLLTGPTSAPPSRTISNTGLKTKICDLKTEPPKSALRYI
jgi:hypothetical protein